MMQYLGIIEQRTNEILQMYNRPIQQNDAAAGKGADKKAWELQTKTRTQSSMIDCPLIGSGERDKDLEDDTAPLNIHDFKHKAKEYSKSNLKLHIGK